MKILYMASDHVPFSWPKNDLGHGGVSTLEPIIIDALRQKHDVDFLVPNDSVVDPSIADNVILGSFASKHKVGRAKMMERTQDMIAAQENYDIVFWNHPRFSQKYVKDIVKFAPKIRAIDHSYPEGYISGFLVVQYHLEWIVSQHGAVVAHLQRGLDDFIEKNLKSISTNPYLIPGYPVGKFGDRFYFTDVMATDQQSLEGDLTNEPIWVAMGRGAAEKKIKLALQSWVEADVDGELVLMVQDPQQKNSEIPELQELASQHDRIKVIVGADRETVFHYLRRARGLIFPSNREAKPLVPYEANCCGTPVVYTIDTAHDYLSKIKGNLYVPRRAKSTYASAIREVHNQDHDKDKMRKETQSLLPPERVAQNILDLVDFTWD